MTVTTPSHKLALSHVSSALTPTAAQSRAIQTLRVDTINESATDSSASCSSSSSVMSDTDGSSSENSATTSITDEMKGSANINGGQEAEEKESELAEAAKQEVEKPADFEGLGERDDVPQGKRRNFLKESVKKRPAKRKFEQV
ncbi:MAG: hypothetical protein LQ346_006623 [Caloplaca aetnensis]|nr:MAG: hypothetical protein LQ346_006623 [Caloplaca aetnensis]